MPNQFPGLQKFEEKQTHKRINSKTEKESASCKVKNPVATN